MKLQKHERREKELCGAVIFRYADTEIPLDLPHSAIYHDKSNRWIERNPEYEAKRLLELTAFPFVDTPRDRFAEHDFLIHQKHLVRLVDELGQRGWIVQLHGKLVRQPSQFNISVESRQDWFDLAVNFNYDNETIPLPKLLEAISRKEHFLILADGSRGRVPAEIVEKYARIAGLSFSIPACQAIQPALPD